MKPLSIDRIKQAVIKQFKLQPGDLVMRKRTERIAWARCVAMFVSYETSGLSSSDVGREFDRDHGTVLSACRTVKDRIETNPQDREDVAKLLKTLKWTIETEFAPSPLPTTVTIAIPSDKDTLSRIAVGQTVTLSVAINVRRKLKTELQGDIISVGLQ